MVSSSVLTGVLTLCPFALAVTVQKPGLQLPSSAASLSNQTRELFSNAYSAYTKFAFGHDDLRPISETFLDDRNGWGATIVDAMDTMKIMGLEDIFQQAVNFSLSIDFSQSKTNDVVSVFESTIRYVGGILSAYQLNNNQPQGLVQKAQQLADKLAIGFSSSPSQIPWGYLDFTTNQPSERGANIAEAGTLTLEWATLSKLTNNARYRNLTESSVKRIISNSAPLPGLPGQGLDPNSGNPSSSYVTWGGGSDSFFEYLIKYPRLDPTVDSVFVRTWQQAVDSSIRFLMKESVVGQWTYLADMDDNRRIVHTGSHLACFHGGNWILGGKLLNNDTIVNAGLKLVDACWNTYASTSTGIGPEAFGFVTVPSNPPPSGSDDGNFPGVPESDVPFLNSHGFYITSGDYILRPEVLESNFYAWRTTGDMKYYNNAQSALQSFQKFLVVPGGEGGVSGLLNVMDTSGSNSNRDDTTASFFFAEVMKYLYLTFDDPSHISLDEWVFNTEAHPFQAPAIAGDFPG